MGKNAVNFYPQNYPQSVSKTYSHVKRLDKVYNFLKTEYVLKKLDLNITNKPFFDEFKLFYSNNGIKITEKYKPDFCQKLGNLGLIYKKSNGNNIYKYSWAEVNEIAIKNKWLCDLDDYDDEQVNTDTIENQIIFIQQEKNKEIELLQEKIKKLELELVKARKEENIIIFPTKKVKSKKVQDDISPTTGDDLFKSL